MISMSFIPITSVLNGVPGSGFLSHAINLYLRCEKNCYFYLHTFYLNNISLWYLTIKIVHYADKPPIEELHQFLEFQLPRQWAPVFSDLPLGPQRKQRSSASLQFSFMGPKLYVNTTQVKFCSWSWISRYSLVVPLWVITNHIHVFVCHLVGPTNKEKYVGGNFV